MKIELVSESKQSTEFVYGKLYCVVGIENNYSSWKQNDVLVCLSHDLSDVGDLVLYNIRTETYHYTNRLATNNIVVRELQSGEEVRIKI